MKKILALLVIVMALPVFAASPKIGYVDLQKAIQKTTAGKKAKKQLEKEFAKRKKDLKKMEDDLQKMTKDFDKKVMVLSDEVRQKKRRALDGEMLKYRQKVGKNQIEIQKKERDLISPIITKLRKIVGKIAQKEGYTVILEKSGQSVLWAKDDINLTDRLIKEYEKNK